MGNVLRLLCRRPTHGAEQPPPAPRAPDDAGLWRPLGGSVVTAVQVTADNIAAIAAWAPDSVVLRQWRDGVRVPVGVVVRSSSPTRVTALIGDWIIRHPRGVFLVLRDAAFRAEFAQAPLPTLETL